MWSDLSAVGHHVVFFFFFFKSSSLLASRAKSQRQTVGRNVVGFDECRTETASKLTTFLPVLGRFFEPRPMLASSPQPVIRCTWLATWRGRQRTVGYLPDVRVDVLSFLGLDGRLRKNANCKQILESNFFFFVCSRSNRNEYLTWLGKCWLLKCACQNLTLKCFTFKCLTFKE